MSDKQDLITIDDNFESSNIVHNVDEEDDSLSGYHRKHIHPSTTIKREQLYDLEGRYAWPMQMKGNKISYWKQQKIMAEKKNNPKGGAGTSAGEPSDGEGESDEGSGDGWGVFSESDFWHDPTPDKTPRQQRWGSQAELGTDIFLSTEVESERSRDAGEPQQVKRRPEEMVVQQVATGAPKILVRQEASAGGPTDTRHIGTPTAPATTTVPQAAYGGLPRPFTHPPDHFATTTTATVSQAYVAHHHSVPHTVPHNITPAYTPHPQHTHHAHPIQVAEDCTVVFFDKALQFRLVKGYTFHRLLCDACSVFDVSRENMVLTDDKGRLWPPSSIVAEEVTGTSPVVYMRNKLWH